MTATPFGPRPPAEIPVPVQDAALERQTPQAATPAVESPDPGIRSLTSTVPPPMPTDLPADAAPMTTAPTPSDLPAQDPANLETSEADTWWQAPLGSAKSESMLPPMLMAMGVLLAIFIVMRALRKRQANAPVPPPPVDRISEIHQRAVGSISPIERAMSDGEQLARRLAATMDNKAARIELLIEEADRKLEELNRAVAAVSRATPASPERAARTLRSIDPALLDLARVEQDRAERNGSHTDDPRRPDRAFSRSPELMPEPIPDRAGASPTPPAPAEPPAGSASDPVHRRVWALADDGMPSMEIARSLNQPVGQVELILNLRKSG